MITLETIKDTYNDGRLRSTEFLVLRNNEVVIQVCASELHFCKPVGVFKLTEYTHYELHTRGSLDKPYMEDYFGEYTLEGANYFNVPREVVEKLLKELQEEGEQ